MFKKIARYLENSSHPLLGPTLWGLRAWGMWQPKRDYSRIIYNLIHIGAVLFVVSQYVELWIIRANLELALRNLSVTMLSTVCVVKAGTFILWQDSWKTIMEFVSTLEQRQISKNDMATKSIVNEYIKYSRNVTYSYWSLVTATVFTVIFAPLASYLSSAENMELIRNGSVPYPEIMSSWAPFEKTRGYGYWILVVEQTLICFYGGGIVANYDSNAIVLMSFFTGQLKLLKSNCTRLFGDGRSIIEYKQAIDRIRECHLHHLDLVRNAKMLNSLLSPVMFLYIIICSLMICASAVQLATDGVTGMQQIWIAEYLIALIAQLFLYCWHGNKVFYMSLNVDEGVYESAWWSQEVRVRRSVMLLSGQLRRAVVFTAGPFNQLTIATFVAILKGSYSYYTILSKKED